jgi:hypothetical protein
MVNLEGLIQLVNGCCKPECEPFKVWVSEVISTLQRDGSYALEPAPVKPAPTGGTAYLMPQQVADAIVGLEERNIRADEALAVAQGARAAEMRRTNDVLGRIADTLDIIADRLQPPVPRPRSRPAEPPTITPQQLLATWKSRNLVVTDDVHAVAAYLAPALVRGPARCRLEDVASRTGLTLDRVHDCVRMLIKRGCMRQVGSEGDGVPVYVLP